MHSFPFPAIWIGGDLGDFRQCDSTYCRYDYLSLPRLPTYLFDGSFSWLRRHPSPLTYDKRFAKGWSEQKRESWKEKAERVCPGLQRAAREYGTALPSVFIAFLLDVDLVTMIRSPTDCYFCLPEAVIPNCGDEGGHFVHFLSDSQNCYEWYLFVDSSKRHCVVASYEDLSQTASPDGLSEKNHQDIVYCGSSFEEFLFRLWIENEIWFRLIEQDQPLTDEMHEYLRSSRSCKEAEE
jgi:hypothetical protein